MEIRPLSPLKSCLGSSLIRFSDRYLEEQNKRKGIYNQELDMRFHMPPCHHLTEITRQGSPFLLRAEMDTIGKFRVGRKLASAPWSSLRLF